MEIRNKQTEWCIVLSPEHTAIVEAKAQELGIINDLEYLEDQVEKMIDSWKGKSE